MASTFIWARRCIPTQKESTFSDPTGSSPTCVKTAVRIRLQSARSIINHQSSMHYEIFRNLSSVFLWVLSKTVHTMEKTRLTLSASWFAMKIFQRKEKMMRIFESIWKIWILDTTLVSEWTWKKKMISESAKSMEINEMTWCSCNYAAEICRKSGICRINIRSSQILEIQFKFSNCDYRWFFFLPNKGLF